MSIRKQRQRRIQEFEDTKTNWLKFSKKEYANITISISSCSKHIDFHYSLEDLLMSDLVSSSSSPRIASCKCLGVIRFTFKSLLAFPASSNTSAPLPKVKKIAVLLTPKLNPT
ncbi:hypothetical protein H5410_059537 [Solanum commersonii]|uniref:Uncharacterized protein n=1 Tax=Solanum commersonii TaxID=4109 RepID=A0A9J5W2N5_SOLCO|nr:hypothetical protein H5410_059537 [Solanum commersonii]